MTRRDRRDHRTSCVNAYRPISRFHKMLRPVRVVVTPPRNEIRPTPSSLETRKGDRAMDKEAIVPTNKPTNSEKSLVAMKRLNFDSSRAPALRASLHWTQTIITIH